MAVQISLVPTTNTLEILLLGFNQSMETSRSKMMLSVTRYPLGFGVRSRFNDSKQCSS